MALNICVLYGGRSGEHEVSLRSAASVVNHLDPSRFSIVLVGIDKGGRWHLQDRSRPIRSQAQDAILSVVPSASHVCLVPADGIHVNGIKLDIDCVFPVMHGSHAEDGTLQGLLEIADLPYVGAGVLGSAASMDKETAKRLWRDGGLPTLPFAVVRRNASSAERLSAAEGIGWPLFVKPCNAGSSLGASKVAEATALDSALAEALQYDTRALLEPYVDAREIECAVVGNASPRAFPPGEIAPSVGHPFYDYDAKYTDPDGARLITNAEMSDSARATIMQTAERAYSAVHCSGMARVDFFVERKSGNIFLNEINTIPGFTNISMFPKMCEAAGLSYPMLLESLIGLAIDAAAEKRTVRYDR